MIKFKHRGGENIQKEVALTTDEQCIIVPHGVGGGAAAVRRSRAVAPASAPLYYITMDLYKDFRMRNRI